MTEPNGRIAAVVLAAGRSQRMGQDKLSMPWGRTTVIGQVVQTLVEAGVEDIVVVTGGASHAVEAALHDTPARTIHNPRYTEDFMLLTLQAGVKVLAEGTEALLVALGDQPQIQVDVTRKVIQAYVARHAELVVPSYRMRRGHPWLAARPVWQELLRRVPPDTPRSFLNDLAMKIEYVEIDNDSILRDLDTPADYERERPRHNENKLVRP